MMNEQRRMREMLDIKIKQRVTHTQNITDFSQNFLDQLDSMRQSAHQDHSSHKILEGQQLSQQLQREREIQHHIQMEIDKLRIRMMEIIKEEDLIKEKVAERRKVHNREKERIEEESQMESQKVENGYEIKKQGILKQIQHLIEEKSQLITQIESSGKEIQKADARNKRAQQNYSKQMKSRKEAYLSIERQKSHKHQQNRVQQIKEQAVKDTEPKLLAIIKSANEDIKKSEEEQKNLLSNFKSQYKLILERQLTEGKQMAFEEGQLQKQQLKAQIDQRNRQRYEQRQQELDQQLSKMKIEYSKRIKQQDIKIQAQMQQFMGRNRDSHEQNMEEIRQLKVTYQGKINKMNNNLQQLQQKKLVEYQQKYKKWYEGQIRDIQDSNDEKLRSAETKMKADWLVKLDKIRREIQKEQKEFKDDVNSKYEKIAIAEQKKWDDAVTRERREGEGIQEKIVALQKRRVKEEARVQQMQRDRNGLMEKRDDFQRKIANHQAQISAFQRLKLERQKQNQLKVQALNQKQQILYQKLKQQYLSRQDYKKAQQKQLLDDLQQQSRKGSQALLAYRSQIESNLESRKSILIKLHEQNGRLQRQNDMLQRQIEQQSRRLRK